MSYKAHLNQVIASHLVELKADEVPDQPIFIFEKGEHGEDILTYKDLHENSNKIARLFLERGIGKGDHYAIYMRNHPEFLYSLLAGMVLGAIAVPVDPRYRGERLKYILHNCKAKAVIASGECLEALEEVLGELPEIKLVSIAYRPEQNIPFSSKYHALNETLEQDTWAAVEQQIMDVRHPMQVIYTSGTTGDPKGVTIRNNRTGLYTILTRIVWQYKKSDILYTGLSLSHGNAQAVTLFPALYLGCQAVFSPRFTKSRIWDICRKYGCTSFSLLGGMMAAIYNEPEKPDDADNPVQVVISAGTPRAIWESFEKRFNVQILEWYGSVEGGFAYKPIGKGPIGSFGKGLPGVMELKVVDENDNEVPPGVTGELICRMIKGDTRVDYLGLPEASKEKTRGGWLRTGDMVHRDENGWLFFDYRKGSELRRAGDFIQPDFVEKVIGEHPDVSEVCVYGIPAASGAPGESDLVAAISPFEGKTIDPVSIYRRCQEELARNFIPSYLQIVDEIPKTISEKPLDRLLREQFNRGEGEIYRYEDYINEL
ncbi:MAG TPA: AMP-binding protein [Bacillota bacterium]|jgi:crotonobetaine/carnitine-CoA ligase|nr:ATP-dependent acyl-CoA ligase [Bacillota bacterium]HOB87002.1 AMP-binding protein [Bacillota bacterium]HOP69416.1 AMP-binding protein [Bacillota bacterium]HPT34378.1 AMP-binding protein [Bacillota bacterium]HPZ64777.1 AMP-binding protein [Bacillota bacterium]